MKTLTAFEPTSNSYYSLPTLLRWQARLRCIVYWWLLLVGVMAAAPLQVRANHAMGADLSYRNIAPNQYEVRLTFYFDCGSLVIDEPPTNPLITVSSALCGQLLNITLAADPNAPSSEVTQLCPTAQSSCNGGTYAGVQQYQYVANLSLPQACSDWTLAYQLPTNQTRSADITNLQSPDIFRLYIEARLNNVAANNNSSVQFSQSPIAYFCNSASLFQQSAYDPDGDSLVYSLAHPLDAPFAPIPYTAGYTVANPFGNTVFALDTQTGDIAFTPNSAQRPVVAVLVQEYRNGVLIGSVRRDMQWVILPCNNQSLTVQAPAVQPIHVCANTPLDLLWQATDPDAGTLAVSSVADLPANATFSVSTAPPLSGFEVVGNLLWTPAIADTGLYFFTLTITDNACPVPSEQQFSYPIYVDYAPYAGPNRTYCQPEGTPVVLTVTGGSSFVWDGGATPITANGSTVLVVPSAVVGATTAYTVVNDCGIADQLNITTTAPFDLYLSPANPSICATQTGVIIEAVIPDDVGGAAYSYAWSPLVGINDPTAAAVYATPNSPTTYTVTVTNVAGCSVTASANVGLSTLTGSATAQAAADTVCAGEAVQLLSEAAVLANLTCGISNATCAGSNVLHTFGTPDDSTYNVTPFNGFWENGRMQILYRAAELQAAGVTAGLINAVGFYVTRKLSAAPFDQYYIKMACTDAAISDGYQVGLAEVAALTNLNTVEGWNMMSLDQPFYWDGTSNLRIEVCHHSEVSDVFDEIAFSPTTYTSVTYDESSVGGSGCLLGEITNSNVRPNTRFSMCQPMVQNNAQIQWIPSAGLSASNIANPIATPTATTTYTVTYSENSCTATAQVTVVVPTVAPELVLQATDTLLCLANGEVQQVGLAISTPLPSEATMVWQPATSLSNANVPNPLASISQTSTYTAVVQLNDACQTTLSNTITITASEPLTASISPQNSTVMAGETAYLTLTASLAPDVLTWLPANGLDTPNYQPTIAVQPTQSTTYAAVVQNAACTDTLYASVTVLPPANDLPCVLLPNAFSPNNDATNDLFGASISLPNSLQLLQVYNRWGERVFESTASTTAWDGTFNGKAQPQGVYAYYALIQCGDTLVEKKGNVSLLR